MVDLAAHSDPPFGLIGIDVRTQLERALGATVTDR
jgi:hypothetical protein